MMGALPIAHHQFLITFILQLSGLHRPVGEAEIITARRKPSHSGSGEVGYDIN